MSTSPLVSTPSNSRRPFEDVKPGDLVTVNVFNPKTGEFNQEAGARVRRIGYGMVWITIAGLDAPHPYEIGCPLVIKQEQVIDW